MLTVYMDNFRQQFLDLIAESSVITVFRHTNPDGDAQGSQWGLVRWLQARYPQKQVFACGLQHGTYLSYYPPLTTVTDEIIAQSSAIILDCANQERIDDQRFKLAERLIKIDHHPDVDQYGDLSWVNTKASSTCEILVDLLRPVEGKPLNQEVSKYLYTGLLTDTLRLTTASTTAHTFSCAAYLVESGISVSEINQALFSLDAIDFKAGAYIRSHAHIIEKGLTYTLLDDQTIEALDILPAILKNRVNDLGNVKEFKIWALCLELREPQGLRWSASLRSNQIVINHIAQKYGGGGHPNACAVRGLTRDELEAMLLDLEACIN